MRIEEFGELVGVDLTAAAITTPEGTCLYRTAAEVREMVAAYCTDGGVFLERGDLVNAHASFTYGRGWFAAGCLIGLLVTARQPEPLPIFTETMPMHLHDHLFEKTGRYARMLGEAQDAVECAPDRESPMYETARAIWQNACVSRERGREWQERGARINALGWFSYGYGFLDAGIRAGLLRITEKRHLFTV
ncbi:MAG: DUF357 domain-containing protein [Methanomicrobiaceae archaeon]|nr:DUF357 domain-containing protein [Methanomicrobiaceae archaeon]